LITAIRFASSLTYFFITTFEALDNYALAAFSLALISFFSSGWAEANHSLTSATLCS